MSYTGSFAPRPPDLEAEKGVSASKLTLTPAEGFPGKWRYALFHGEAAAIARSL
jgi:hypothetical protein